LNGKKINRGRRVERLLSIWLFIVAKTAFLNHVRGKKGRILIKIDCTLSANVQYGKREDDYIKNRFRGYDG
jgi:hypothetical protein